MKWMAVTVVCVGPLAVLAQEHPYLSRFELVEQPGAVRVEWTMIAGNTCTDIEVWRGTHTSDLHPIGTIHGLCGNISEPVFYEWTDHQPPENSVLYYRIVLGTSGPSSILSIDFDQFTSSDVRVVRTDADRVEVFLNVPFSADVEWRCYTADGRPLGYGSGTGQWHAVDLGGAASGAYIFTAVAEGRMFTARFALP
jgi:hypothetical protein